MDDQDRSLSGVRGAARQRGAADDACSATDTAGLPEFGEHQRRHFDNSPRPMRIFDRESLHYLAVNDAALALYGYTREEFLRLTLRDTRHPSERDHPVEFLDRPEGYLMHFGPRRHLRKSGEVIIVEVIAQDVLLDGRPARVSLVLDVTAEKRAQEQRLRHAIEQRDALVKEVHHRIKNHLQGIAGLLRSKATDNPAAAETIEAAVAQLQAVAVIYGLQSELVESGVPLARVLEAICLSAEGLSAASIVRAFAADADGVRLATAEAVPVAVALNELVFNAIEHGARGGRPARIEVALAEKPNGADIRIVNRGRLPDRFDYPGGIGTGTGLGLVRTLLGPAGGKLEFSARGGKVEACLSLRPPLVSGRKRPRRTVRK